MDAKSACTDLLEQGGHHAVNPLRKAVHMHIEQLSNNNIIEKAVHMSEYTRTHP